MYNEIIDLEELADRTHEKIVKVYITDLLKNYNKTKWEDLTIYDRHRLVNWVASCKKKTNLSLDCICTTAFECRKQILADKCDKSKFYEILGKSWQS